MVQRSARDLAQLFLSIDDRVQELQNGERALRPERFEFFSRATHPDVLPKVLPGRKQARAEDVRGAVRAIVRK